MISSAGQEIDLGTDTAGKLSLTDLELDRVTAGTIQIGDADSGPITLSADITRSSAAIVNLTSGGAINFTDGSLSSNGGDVALAPGSAASVGVAKTGVDIAAGSLGHFGLRLRLRPEHRHQRCDGRRGVSAAQRYRQDQLDGRGPGVDRTYSPADDDVLIIVNNDGSDAITGTFTGLDEGDLVDVNGAQRRITYAYLGGNDVALVEPNTPPTIDSEDTASVPENSTAVLTVTASDVESPPQVVTFSVSGGADAALFDITPEGALTFGTAPDFEGTHGNSYEVEVTANDGAGGLATQTIIVTVTDVSYSVSLEKLGDAAEGGAAAAFRVNLSHPASVDFQVSYAASGTALEGTDYAAILGPVTVSAGASSAQFTIAATNDDIVEAVESLIVTLSGIPSDPDFVLDASAVNRTATATITDNDTASVSLAATNGSEPATSGKFTVTQSNPSSTSTMISFTVQPTSTAIAGVDYAALSGTVTIPAGSTTADIHVNVFDDVYVEGTETIVVKLTGITSANPDITLGTAPTATVNILDNDAISPIPADNTVTITADPASPGKTMIVLVGTAGGEVLAVDQANGGFIQIKRNNVAVGAAISAANISRIVMFGRAGNDTLKVDPRLGIVAQLFGEDGNDALNGAGGPDTLVGGPGNDYFKGGAGQDLILGGEGHDTLYGEAGIDALFGEVGNDSLFGGTENDVLQGGAASIR